MKAKCGFDIILWALLYYLCLQEAVLEIHYVKREEAPEPGESLQHDDWVSAVRANGNL